MFMAANAQWSFRAFERAPHNAKPSANNDSAVLTANIGLIHTSTKQGLALTEFVFVYELKQMFILYNSL